MYYFIAKIDELSGEPKLYNKDNGNWFSFNNGSDATLFSSHDEAERLIKQMVNNPFYRKFPLFLVTGKAI